MGRWEFFHQDFSNIMKQTLSVARNSESARQRTLHQNRIHFAYIHALLVLPNLDFKFSPVFIGMLCRFRFNLVTFWLLIFYGSCSSFASSTSLLIRIIKILNRLNVDFYRVFNLNMFLLCSYFPWNIVTC